MAIAEDVLDILAATINVALYPGGVGTTNVAGVATLIYSGWPTPEKLDRDIKAGRVHVSVFPRPEERDTSRFPSNWVQMSVDEVAGTGVSMRTIRNQEVLVQITVWAPSPDTRKAIYRAIDGALAGTYRIQMPDGSWASLTHRNAYTDDSDQKAGVFIKHVFYLVDYATTETRTDHVILNSTANVGVMP